MRGDTKMNTALDAAAAVSAVPRLAVVLRDCVDAGAALSLA